MIGIGSEDPGDGQAEHVLAAVGVAVAALPLQLEHDLGARLPGHADGGGVDGAARDAVLQVDLLAAHEGDQRRRAAGEQVVAGLQVPAAEVVGGGGG